MTDIINSAKKLTKDLFGIATAPVEVAIDTARIITKPIANVTKEIVKEIKQTVEEIPDE